ncbi:hypothetical protein ACP70R_037859 [Stipagrostis hirtigluma subsp. patula]
METDEDVKMATQVDEINSYSFLYPVELPGQKFSFKWVESRKPERYSSAAPLSPDARQRIVSERVDMINNVVISVSIGPPNPRFLPSKDKSTWDAKDVADCILSDRSTLKVTTGQRMTESSVLDAHSTDVEGEPYWYYEYLVRKSPTKSALEPNLFRHNVACTAERDGYLYSLNASTLSKQWDSMGPFLQKAVESFRLLPPTEKYVPPYKDPWRFCATPTCLGSTLVQSLFHPGEVCWVSTSNHSVITRQVDCHLVGHCIHQLFEHMMVGHLAAAKCRAVEMLLLAYTFLTHALTIAPFMTHFCKSLAFVVRFYTFPAKAPLCLRTRDKNLEALACMTLLLCFF